MDPLWASITEWWWIGPSAIAAGALGFVGLRRSRDGHARRLGYVAARHALRAEQAQVANARIEVKVARAELARTQAEKAASRATSADVAVARQRLQSAQRDTKSAAASVRVWRTRVSAERAMLHRRGGPDSFPLARIMTVHDTVTARWMEYETDPAKLIAFPTMSDGRTPLVAAYLAAHREAQRLRPASARERVTPEQFAEYREAVARLEHAFASAEQDAWRQARAAGTVPPAPTDQPAPVSWTAVAQTIVSRSAAAFVRATETEVRITDPRGRATDAGTPSGTAHRPASAPDSAHEAAAPVWPVPARSDKRPQS